MDRLYPSREEKGRSRSRRKHHLLYDVYSEPAAGLSAGPQLTVIDKLGETSQAAGRAQKIRAEYIKICQGGIDLFMQAVVPRAERSTAGLHRTNLLFCNFLPFLALRCVVLHVIFSFRAKIVSPC